MRRLWIALVLCLVAAACGDDGDAAPSPKTTTTSTSTTTTPPTTTPPSTTVTIAAMPVPGDEWGEPLGLEAGGFDADRFQAALDLAEEVDSHCMMVLRDGQLIHEYYAPEAGPDDDFEVFSVTKSVTAAIVGAAVQQGHLAVDDPASHYIDAWRDTASEAVTIEQILQNTSGRFYDPVPDLFDLGGRPDMTQHSIDLEQEREPDTAWFYNQSAIQTLDAVLEDATGTDTEAFAQAHLFEPAGMTVSYRRDAAGNIPLFAGLQAGCPDLARFALLTARLGAWGREQLIPSDYMAAAVTGSEINQAYGYLYWHNAEPGTWDHTNPARDRSQRFWPDLPIDTFSANGLGEQFAMVFPTEDVIVVRIGPPTGIQGYDGVLANDLPALVLDALA